MVGHTGVIPATIKACEVVDECLGKVVKETMLLGGVSIVTADHGNAEIMLTESGGVETEHSCSPVPCIFVHERFRGRGEVAKGRLADVAPSILSLLNIPIPNVMTGRNLLDTHL
jgi:2,3-bisphosphoglycerate-independent phosphoglycerate mutase